MLTMKLNNWVELIGKTANDICNYPVCNRIKLNGRHTDLIIEANDAGVLAVRAGLLKDILIKFNFGGVDDYRL
jgi:hypothetical protein